MDNNIYKLTLKKWKKARNKATRPYKFFSILTGIFSVLMTVTLVFFILLDNLIVIIFPSDVGFWKLENEDTSAVYYPSEFNDEEERLSYGEYLVSEVEAEGATLLYNNDATLPLNKGSKVTLMSNSSVDIMYSGTGSVDIDSSSADSLKDALEKANLVVNDTMWNFYEEKENTTSFVFSDYFNSFQALSVDELPWDEYTDEALSSINEYNDAVIVTLSRAGGEAADLNFEHGDITENYLTLSDDEKTLLEHIKEMKENGTINKIIILINSSNPLQMDFMKDNIYDVDAILWIGMPGESGIDAVGQILSGDINPSGGLVDTYCYDNYSSPAMVNNEATYYDGDLDQLPDLAKKYEVYAEGIYIGYKYYETRYEDYVMNTGNAGNYVYSDIVTYPFGYGLSYTDFSFSNFKVNKSNDGMYEIEVTVTNTGNVAGKQTAEIYIQTPYTDYDKQYQIEKAAVQLVGFAKSKLLEPQESEVLTIEVDPADFACYDSYGEQTYILDAGTYYFAVASNAHEALNNILATKGYTKQNTNGRMDGDGNTTLVSSFELTELDNQTCSISKTGIKITNKLTEADINTYSGRGDNYVTYLSRSDWTGTFPKEKVQLTLTDQMIADLQIKQYDSSNYEDVSMPTLNADNGVTLYDMIGLDYDDPKWDELLDELSFDEMVTLVADDYHWIMSTDSINAPGTRSENGPSGLTTAILNSSSGISSTAFTSEDIMAATFNTELINRVGEIIGEDCLAYSVSFIYGPGNNIHRTPYGGRNCEYYSEDSFLSGKISAYEVAGIESKGVHVVAKHFCLNNSEQERFGLGVWTTEQANREIYLKAYEDIFEEGNANGVMLAYTRFGCIWSGGYENLMTGILKDEWGCNGFNITDAIFYTYPDGVDGLAAGGVTAFNALIWHVSAELPNYSNDAYIVSKLRDACHRDLYAICNSVAMNGIGPDTKVIKTIPTVFVVMAIIVAVLWISFIVFTIITVRKKKKFIINNPKPIKTT